MALTLHVNPLRHPSLRTLDPDEPAYRFVAVDPVDGFEYPAAYRDRIMVDTLHDGDGLPARVVEDPAVVSLRKHGELTRHFDRERDWGANLVAHHLSAALGLGGYHRVEIARIAMDFNRFPGISPPDAGPMDRLALGPPLGPVLPYETKRHVLETCYDAVSAGLDAAIAGKLLKICIHTYDARNASQTRRAEISLLTRSESYQQLSRLPVGLFDPLFPDVLAESSVKPILRDRIALTLEKAGFEVAHNFPYRLPDGSVEIRCQPWIFFQWLRERFEAVHPETPQSTAFQLVWDMLLNTNQRRQRADALSGYLHRFRLAPPERAAAFDDARRAYEALCAWVADNDALIEGYRRSPDRFSALTIEVRKDLVWEFDGATPVRPRVDAAREIGTRIAESVATYLREDRI